MLYLRDLSRFIESRLSYEALRWLLKLQFARSRQRPKYGGCGKVIINLPATTTDVGDFLMESGVRGILLSTFCWGELC